MKNAVRRLDDADAEMVPARLSKILLTVTEETASGAALVASGAAAAAELAGFDGEESSSWRLAPAALQTWLAKSRVAFWSVALQSFSIWVLMPVMKPVLPQMQV